MCGSQGRIDVRKPPLALSKVGGGVKNVFVLCFPFIVPFISCVGLGGMGCKEETYCGQKAGEKRLLGCSGQSQPSAGVQQALECCDMILWSGQFSTSFSSASIT